MPDAIAHICNRHDLLVIERNPYTAWGSPADLGAIVLASGFPCIVTSSSVQTASFDGIALAWNGSAEGIRAIHVARPLMGIASRVVLLDGAQQGSDRDLGWAPRFDIDGYLAQHSIMFERRVITASSAAAGAALLDASAEINADLLVMGACGRSCVSEWAFGGVTRAVLSDAPLPVLLHK